MESKLLEDAYLVSEGCLCRKAVSLCDSTNQCKPHIACSHAEINKHFKLIVKTVTNNQCPIQL